MVRKAIENVIMKGKGPFPKSFVYEGTEYSVVCVLNAESHIAHRKLVGYYFDVRARVGEGLEEKLRLYQELNGDRWYLEFKR